MTYVMRGGSGGGERKGDSRDGDVTYLISKLREFACDFNKSLNQTTLSCYNTNIYITSSKCVRKC
jgi:hypothetical protein